MHTVHTADASINETRSADSRQAVRFFLPFFGESEHFCHPANRHSLQIGEKPWISVDKLWTLWIIQPVFALRDVDKSALRL